MFAEETVNTLDDALLDDFVAMDDDMDGDEGEEDEVEDFGSDDDEE